MTAAPHVLVLGPGPAGAACAIGLVRLGYRVTVIASPRPWQTVEGISERTLLGLRNAGFERALSAVAEPTARHVVWNGETSRANSERIVNRADFDAGLFADLGSHGVTVIHGRAGSIRTDADGHRVTIDGEGSCREVHGDFLVEARGRAAPLDRDSRQRGVETISVLQRWQSSGTGRDLAAGSAVQSFADGWLWVAAMGHGTGYVQATLDVASAGGQGRFALHRLLEQVCDFPLVRQIVGNARADGDPQARGSTPILCGQAVGDRWIRIGDAAMAVDPLSGNGIFQSLSSALIAPAVINTLLRQPDSADLAQRFYQARLDHLFARFSRMGRDFYRAENQWPDRPFWVARQRWPDDIPLHAPTDAGSARIEQRPVLCDGFIVEREVVVTDDQPLGMWHVDGVELATVLTSLRQQELDRSIPLAAQLADRFDLPPDRAKSLGSWLLTQGLAR